jgi:hypothetical protein
LLASGADKEARDKDGWSPIMFVRIDLMDKNCAWLLRVLLLK